MTIVIAQSVKAIREAFATMSQQAIGDYGRDILIARDQSATQAMRTWVAIWLHLGHEEARLLAVTLSPDSKNSNRQYSLRISNLCKNAVEQGHARKLNDFKGTFKDLVALAAKPKQEEEQEEETTITTEHAAPVADTAPRAAELSAAYDMLEALFSQAATVKKAADMRTLLTDIALKGAEALAVIKG